VVVVGRWSDRATIGIDLLVLVSNASLVRRRPYRPRVEMDDFASRLALVTRWRWKSSVESRGVAQARFVTVLCALQGQFLMMLVKEGKEYCNKSFRHLYKGEVGVGCDDIFDGVRCT
jgi:hypothetical protein